MAQGMGDGKGGSSKGNRMVIKGKGNSRRNRMAKGILKRLNGKQRQGKRNME